MGGLLIPLPSVCLRNAGGRRRDGGQNFGIKPMSTPSTLRPVMRSSVCSFKLTDQSAAARPLHNYFLPCVQVTMATAQVEAGDLHFTAIGNIPGASVAIQLWPNDDARGGPTPLTRERGRMTLHVVISLLIMTNKAAVTFIHAFYLTIH